jgi:transcriptional regulator with XRE-family HTH domain
MSIDVRPGATLSAQVAEEIRALMARRRIRQSQLAREIGENDQWVSVRLNGRQAIDLNDLQRIAEALDVSPADLLTATGTATIRERTSRRRDRHGLHADLAVAGVSRPPGRASNARTSATRPRPYPPEKRRPIILVQPAA